MQALQGELALFRTAGLSQVLLLHLGPEMERIPIRILEPGGDIHRLAGTTRHNESGFRAVFRNNRRLVGKDLERGGNLGRQMVFVPCRQRKRVLAGVQLGSVHQNGIFLQHNSLNFRRNRIEKPLPGRVFAGERESSGIFLAQHRRLLAGPGQHRRQNGLVQVHGERTVRIQFFADIAGPVKEVGPGAPEDAGTTFLGREAGAAEVGHQQGRNAGNMRAGHGSALPVRAAVAAVAHQGAVDALLAVSAGSGDVQPVSVVGVRSLVARGAEGPHRNDGLIGNQRVIVEVVVAGSEDGHAALHGRIRQLVAVVVTAGILDKVVQYRLVFR